MELSKANSWFKFNELMQPDITKTKHFLICPAKKLYHSEVTTLELSIHNARLKESVEEELLCGVIDPHLS